MHSMHGFKNYWLPTNSTEVEMVDKGNVDKYRRSMSGLRVENKETWGRAKAVERYGKLDFRDGAPRPPDKSEPQFKQTDGRGPDWRDNTAKDWRVGFGKGGTESAQGKPNFQAGIRRPGKV